MTTQNIETPEGSDSPNVRHAALTLRMAESLKTQSEQILRLTKMVVKLQRQSPGSGLGLPNIVRDGLLAFLTGYVVIDIIEAVAS